MERQELLRNVRQRLGRRQGPPPPPPRWQPPRELFHKDSSVRERVFVEQALLQGAEVVRVPSRAEARRRVEALLKHRGWTRVAADPELRWHQGVPVWVEEPLSADFGLCEAERALAETGSVVVKPGGERRRQTSLLPPSVGFFVGRSRIVSRLTDLAKELDGADGALPACINLISGPSRTADIELDLCIGVHGPGEVHIWVIEDE